MQVLLYRYLLLGGAVGGGASLAKQYEEWKKATFVFSYKSQMLKLCWNFLTGTNAEIGMSVITFKIYQSKEPNIN